MAPLSDSATPAGLAYWRLGIAAAVKLILLLLGAAGVHLSKHDKLVNVAVPLALVGAAAG